MDFSLNAEQELLRQTVREFVRRDITPVAHEFEHEGRYPSEIVERMKELGLFGMLVPTRYGGADLDAVAYAVVFDELSQGWMGVAGILGSHSLATRLITCFGTSDQKGKWLPPMASGAARSGFALTEPGAGSDLQGISTTAVAVDGGYRVNGTKTWITNARHADVIPVLVKTDPSAKPRYRGMSMLLIERETSGYSVGRDFEKLGYKGPETSEIVLEDAFVPAANLLGDVEGEGMKQALAALEFGRINVAARAVGLATAAYDRAVEYAQQRRAFGQTISDFQAIRLQIADMATDIQAARLMTYWAAELANEGRRADRETSMAKYFASEVALRCALTSMRIHGAYGYSKEFDIERIYRDAPLMAIGEGTSDILRLAIARSVLGDEKSLSESLARTR